jgi:hypothetical protein
MADIEFEEIVGEIEDRGTQQHERMEEGRLDADPERLRRLIRDEQARAIRLAHRLMA